MSEITLMSQHLGDAPYLTGVMFLALDVISKSYSLIWDRNLTKFRLPKPAEYMPKKNGTVQQNATKELNQNKDTSYVNSTKVHSRPRNVTDYEKGHKDLCKNSWQEDYTKLHQHLIQTNQKFLIFTCPRSGWGNRLRDLLTYFHFAVIAKRAFIINCNIPSPLDRYLAPRNIEWNYKLNSKQLTYRRASKVFLNDVKDPSDPKVFDRLLNHTAQYSPQLIGVQTRWFIKPLKYDLPVWPNQNQMMGCSFYYLFRKSDMLQKRLDEWKEELGFNDNIVIGIHIREGDSVFHHNQGDYRFRTTEDADFSFICAEQIQAEIEKKYKTDKVIWFLAADSEERKAAVKQKYGSKVRCITGPIEHVGHATKGNEDAGHLSMFLDYFLLREADYRLYTSPSTFDKAIDITTLGSKNSARTLFRGERKCNLPASLRAT